MADRAQNMDGHYAIPKDDLDKLRAAADLLARVRAECHVAYPHYNALDGDAYYDELLIEGRDDLMRELAEALSYKPITPQERHAKHR